METVLNHYQLKTCPKHLRALLGRFSFTDNPVKPTDFLASKHRRFGSIDMSSMAPWCLSSGPGGLERWTKTRTSHNAINAMFNGFVSKTLVTCLRDRRTTGHKIFRTSEEKAAKYAPVACSS